MIYQQNLPYLQQLPVYKHKDEIVAAIRTHQVTIISGSTGSGKTTQLPLMCLEARGGSDTRIVVTQPRRIAATAIAERLASQLGVNLGSFVGYRTRFDFRESKETCIRCVTDGILLSEIHKDPLFCNYDFIMIDEVHERSLNIDFLLGYLRKILPQRPSLKLIISSATADTRLFSSIFENAPIYEIAGNVFPISVWYTPPSDESDYLTAVRSAIYDMVDLIDNGDILVFLPTERDIMAVMKLLQGDLPRNAVVLPLFARLPRQQQQLVFASQSFRKIILATNVAETSLTIPGIVGVIDSGRARVKHYAPHARITRLPVEFVSKASADQRKGRCGRVCEGVCIRLYSEYDYSAMDAFTPPEIFRSNLSDVILSMTSLHLGRIDAFPFPEMPPKNAISDGYKHLRDLGALTKQDTLTALGTAMARFPIDAYISRMIVAAQELGVVREILVITSALSIIDPRVRPLGKESFADAAHKKWIEPESDFVSFLRMWEDYHADDVGSSTSRLKKYCVENYLAFMRMREWEDIHEQLSRCAGIKTLDKSIPLQIKNTADLHKALLCGLVSGIAQKQENGQYRLVRGGTMQLFPGSALHRKKPDWIMVSEIVETSNVYGRIAAKIDPVWIEEMLPYLCKKHYGEPRFDVTTQSVKALEYITFYGLPLSAGKNVEYGPIDSNRATDIFISDGIVAAALTTRFAFLENLLALRKKICRCEAKIRQPDLLIGEMQQCSWFAERLTNVYSVKTLQAALKEKGSDLFLTMRESELLVREIPASVEGFPDTVTIGCVAFAVDYVFAPGETLDGIYVRIPLSVNKYIPTFIFDWCIPGIRREQVFEVLTCLPKEIRKSFFPLEQSADRIAADLIFSPKPIIDAILQQVMKEVTEKNPLSLDSILSQHLKPGSSLAAATQPFFSEGFEKYALGCFENAYGQFRKKNLSEWSIEDLPECRVLLESTQGFSLYGYPALQRRDGVVDCCLFSNKRESLVEHEKGVAALLHLNLAAELSWFEKELSGSQDLKILAKPHGGFDLLRSNLIAMIHAHSECVDRHIRTQKDFLILLSQRKKELALGGRKATDIAAEILSTVGNLKKTIRIKQSLVTTAQQKKSAADLMEKCDWYGTWLFDPGLSMHFFMHIPRYIQAFSFRVAKAFVDPLKYEKRLMVLIPLYARLESFRARSARYPRNGAFVQYLIGCEEMNISLFAQQEVKTAATISEKILADLAQRVEEMLLELRNRTSKTN